MQELGHVQTVEQALYSDSGDWEGALGKYHCMLGLSLCPSEAFQRQCFVQDGSLVSPDTDARLYYHLIQIWVSVDLAMCANTDLNVVSLGEL